MFSIRNQKNERKKMKLDLISETKRVDSISNQKDRNKGFRFDSNRKNRSQTLTLAKNEAAGLPWVSAPPLTAGRSRAGQQSERPVRRHGTTLT